MSKRRRYGALSGVTLGFVGASVSSTDVAIGAAAGLAGAEVVEMAMDHLMAPHADGSPGMKLPSLLQKAAPLLGGAVAGGALYYMGKANKSKAEGRLLGALLMGAGLVARRVLSQLMQKAPAAGQMNDYRLNDYRLNDYRLGDPLQHVSLGDPMQNVNLGGVIVDQTHGYDGVIVDHMGDADDMDGYGMNP